MKIAVGLSGGVDSATALYLLKEEGHDVVGITMKICEKDSEHKHLRSACFGAGESEDIEEARKLAESLNIPYYVIDLSSEFNSNILNYFKEEYLSGRTPNPCMKCNQMMKFGLLLKKTLEQHAEFDCFATGHYANVQFDKASGRYLLKKGFDEKKDQSYFLALLTQEQLSKVVFPLGSYTKPQVRELARKINLAVHDRKESQDFYSGDYTDLIGQKDGQGKITDQNGKVLGIHKGLFHYTIGQRKGLGISSNKPLYVVGIKKDNNNIIVGTEDKLFKKGLIVRNPNWISIDCLKEELRASVKVRYAHKEADAVLVPAENSMVKIEFDSPQKAIAAGQYAVFYSGDTVIGGGAIDAVLE